MRSKLESAYLRQYFAGKSAAARFLNRVLFCFLSVLGVYYAVISFLKNIAPAVFAGFIAGMIFLLGSDIYFRFSLMHFIKERRRSAAKTILRRRLLLADPDELNQQAKTLTANAKSDTIKVIQKAQPLSEDELLAEVRQNRDAGSITIVSISGFSPEAEKLAPMLHDPEVKLIKADTIPGLSDKYHPSDRDVDEEIIVSSSIVEPGVQASPKPKFSGISLLNSLWLCAVVFALSFLSSAGIYLRIASAAILVVGLLTAAISMLKRKTSGEE